MEIDRHQTILRYEAMRPRDQRGRRVSRPPSPPGTAPPCGGRSRRGGWVSSPRAVACVACPQPTQDHNVVLATDLARDQNEALLRAWRPVTRPPSSGGAVGARSAGCARGLEARSPAAHGAFWEPGSADGWRLPGRRRPRRSARCVPDTAVRERLAQGRCSTRGSLQPSIAAPHPTAPGADRRCPVRTVACAVGALALAHVLLAGSPRVGLHGRRLALRGVRSALGPPLHDGDDRGEGGRAGDHASA
jgi:hypothetical protein